MDMMVGGAAAPDASTLIAEVFGPAARGVSGIKEWARNSMQTFVRSQTHIARWSPKATGVRLSAFEALEAFGWQTLSQLADKRAVAIVEEGCEAAPVLRRRRGSTGLTVAQLAKKVGLTEEEVRAAEEGEHRMPVRVLIKLAQALALDSDRIGYVSDGGGDEALGVRLREIRTPTGKMSAPVVLGLAEAAWAIATQSRLEAWLDPERTCIPYNLGFRRRSANRVQGPAWRDGMQLAHEARELLGLDRAGPVHGLKDLIEGRLSIPVIQVKLPETFAGATIVNGSARGIAVNDASINRNVWTRRMTVAHELGHLLWDPDEELNRLRVDDHASLERNWRDLTDKVEMRANAFAAEFLAPQNAVATMFADFGRGPDAVFKIMDTFGISFTAASWQIYNGSKQTVDRSTLRTPPRAEPSREWEAEVSSTASFFVIRETPISRRGRFAELCLKAYHQNLISQDTSAEYLGTTPEAFLGALPSLRSLLQKP